MDSFYAYIICFFVLWIIFKIKRTQYNESRRINNNNRQPRRRILPPFPRRNSRELIMIRIDRTSLYKTIDPPDGECVICLDSYNNDMECCSIKCKHTFHKECINTWFNEKQSCPLCRESII